MASASGGNPLEMVSNIIAHFRRAGFDDIFKPPMFASSIELAVLRQEIPELESHLRREALKFLSCKDNSKCWITKPKEFFIPKDSYTFRRDSWLDPLDAVKYTLLVCSMADQIEAKRVCKEKRIIHSYRYALSDKQFFLEDFGYASFKAASKNKTDCYVGGYKLVTDISNFYDRISIHSIENILCEIGCDKSSYDFLNKVLLFFSNGNSFGIPIGGEASRILAEAALINVDDELLREGIDFIRYVDDYRVFANSRASIYKAMLVLTQSLHKQGLFINFAKTQIVEITQALSEAESEFKLISEEHESIDETKTEFSLRKIASVSGRTRVSRFYRKPGIEAINALSKINIAKLLTGLISKTGIEQEKSIRDAVKYYLYVKKDHDIILAVLKFKITSIIYVSDALVKDGDRLSVQERAEVVDLILTAMDMANCPYPYQLPVLKILSSKYFLRSDKLISFFKKMNIHDNPIFFREVVAMTGAYLSRMDLRSVCHDSFAHWTPETQRVIMSIVQATDTLARSERDAVIINMRNSTSDYIVKHQ